MSTIYVGTVKAIADLVLVPNENLYTGSKKIMDCFGELDALDEDLLNVASGIYAADLATPRRERELHCRDIEITIEVVHKQSWDQVQKKLQYALYVLSKDNWKIAFVKRKIKSSTYLDWNGSEGAVLLFSGGIDSMAGASEFLTRKEPLVLVSHSSQGNSVVDKSQKDVYQALCNHYKQKVPYYPIKVYGRNKGAHTFPDERENTQRTRSFLFLTLAALVMKKNKMSKILFMAENGQFAVHLPLNQARVGPFSTHTADPLFLQYAQEIFSHLLENDNFCIENPFLYKTKAEVFAVLPDPLKKKAIHSASCWKISRTKQHCGECVPCISRRIAIEYNGLSFNEYLHDVFKSDLKTLPEDNTGKRNMVDYLEFISTFKSIGDIKALINHHPELHNDAFDLEKVIKMYHNMAKQSYKVLDKYPNVVKMY
ncbi:7-cyano-7-deazaguanine synthase [Chitinophaga ginsengisegetis]|uniref:7-cyano-7-deazaguanine synthase n=1 Tax=Chitinophaga ginsengisegetis TaxID=393003 RepID=UPI0034259AE6